MEQVRSDAAQADPGECGCAPSPAEARALWPSAPLTRRSALTIGALGIAAVGAFGFTSGVSIAYADDYPTWDDVQAAKANETKKASEIKRIEGLIAGLTTRVIQTQAAAEKASNAYFEAQQEYFDAADTASQLQTQADEQADLADVAARKAAEVAAQLYRNGGSDTSLDLFFSGSADSADQLLSKLGLMDKLLEHNQSLYDNAVSARNTAQQLSDQAAVARDERDRLQKIAEDKLIAAQEAQAQAESALAAQEQHLDTLESQLAALKDETAKTVAGYQEGVAERKRIEEARRKAEEERLRREAEEAKKAAEEAEKDAGSVTGSGWARPHGGRISSRYGPRTSKCTNGYCSSSYHRGLDFANGCGAYIYAASSGTVNAALYNGGYGNYIRISHGGGISTGYAHIRSGGFLVRSGQHVTAGQVIAYAGNTGNSFGCHLHFEVYTSSGTVNPEPFLNQRGVSV